jgi:hypothetical protein
MSPEARAKFQGIQAKFAEEEKRYNAEKKEIENKAREHEHERDRNKARNPNFEFAEALLQIAVVTASIAILATSRMLYSVSIVFAVLGALLCLNGYLLVVSLPH